MYYHSFCLKTDLQLIDLRQTCFIHVGLSEKKSVYLKFIQRPFNGVINYELILTFFNWLKNCFFALQRIIWLLHYKQPLAVFLTFGPVFFSFRPPEADATQKCLQSVSKQLILASLSSTFSLVSLQSKKSR